MATVEAKRRAQAAYAARLKEGEKAKVTLWLEPDDKATLDRLAEHHGSIPKAVEHWLRGDEAPAAEGPSTQSDEAPPKAKPSASYPPHPRWGPALTGKPFMVDDVTFYGYRKAIMRFVWANPDLDISVDDVTWKNGNPRGYQGVAPGVRDLPIRKSREEAARDAVRAVEALAAEASES